MNFYCPYCDRRCKKYDPDSTWWHCKDCNVNMEPDKATVFHIHNPDESFYSLCIYHSRNETCLDWQRGPKRPDESQEAYDELPRIKILLTLKFAMQGVTPDNAHDKIRTLITFS